MLGMRPLTFCAVMMCLILATHAKATDADHGALTLTDYQLEHFSEQWSSQDEINFVQAARCAKVAQVAPKQVSQLLIKTVRAARADLFERWLARLFRVTGCLTINELDAFLLDAAFTLTESVDTRAMAERARALIYVLLDQSGRSISSDVFDLLADEFRYLGVSWELDETPEFVYVAHGYFVEKTGRQIDIDVFSELEQSKASLHLCSGRDQANVSGIDVQGPVCATGVCPIYGNMIKDLEVDSDIESLKPKDRMLCARGAEQVKETHNGAGGAGSMMPEGTSARVAACLSELATKRPDTVQASCVSNIQGDRLGLTSLRPPSKAIRVNDLCQISMLGTSTLDERLKEWEERQKRSKINPFIADLIDVFDSSSPEKSLREYAEELDSLAPQFNADAEDAKGELRGAQDNEREATSPR